MFIRRWLSTLAGARWDILSQTPVDHFRYVATGGVLLTTAGVAAISAAFALTTAMHISLLASIIVGIAWGVVILNLDRLLIIGMTRRTGWLRNIIAALPRLALAILIGMVISTPLVLRIFQPEIETEMKVHQNERKEAFQERLAQNPRYAEIPGLQQQLDAKLAEANQSPDAVAAQNPSVQAAQQKAEAARVTYEAAAKAAQCEIVGNCGTFRPGVARAALEAIAARDVALGAYNDARTQLANAQALAREAAVKAPPRPARKPTGFRRTSPTGAATGKPSNPSSTSPRRTTPACSPASKHSPPSVPLAPTSASPNSSCCSCSSPSRCSRSSSSSSNSPAHQRCTSNSSSKWRKPPTSPPPKPPTARPTSPTTTRKCKPNWNTTRLAYNMRPACARTN